MCGTSPLSAQRSTTVAEVRSDIGSLCIKNLAVILCLFYDTTTVGQQYGRGRVKDYRNVVWSKVFSVENFNGKNMFYYWGK
jgi:hypothetical protein